MTGLEPALIFGLLSTGISAIGAISSARADSKANKYNAAVNAQNATQTRKQGVIDADRASRMARLRAGTNVANVGGSGITLEGSALDVLEENAKEESLNQLRIVHASEIQAIGFDRNAAMSTSAAANAKTKGRFGVASAVLNGATKLSGKEFGFGSKSAPAPNHADQITF